MLDDLAIVSMLCCGWLGDRKRGMFNFRALVKTWNNLTYCNSQKMNQ